MTRTGTPVPSAVDRDELGRGLTGAAIAVCAWSTGTVITKHIDMGGLAIAAYRFWIFSIGILIWIVRSWRADQLEEPEFRIQHVHRAEASP